MNGTRALRDVLADNLEKLRAASISLRRYPDIAKAGGPSNGTLGRISLREQAATVDVVASLAKVFGLEPWQILVPDLDVKANGTNHPTVGGLPGWPFPKVPQARYEGLASDDQIVLQGRVLEIIERMENERPPKRLGRIK